MHGLIDLLKGRSQLSLLLQTEITEAIAAVAVRVPEGFQDADILNAAVEGTKQPVRKDIQDRVLLVDDQQVIQSGSMMTAFRDNVFPNQAVDHGTVHAPAAEQMVQVPLRGKTVADFPGQLIQRLPAGHNEAGQLFRGGGEMSGQQGSIRLQKHRRIQKDALILPAQDAAADHPVNIFSAETAGQVIIEGGAGFAGDEDGKQRIQGIHKIPRIIRVAGFCFMIDLIIQKTGEMFLFTHCRSLLADQQYSYSLPARRDSPEWSRPR